MTTDAHGNPTTGSLAAIARFDVDPRPAAALRRGVLDLMASTRHRRARLPHGPGAGGLPDASSSTDVPRTCARPARRPTSSSGCPSTLGRRPTPAPSTPGSAGDWHEAPRLGSTTCSCSGRPTCSPCSVGHQLDFFLGDAAEPARPSRAARSAASIPSTRTTGSSWACTPSGSRSPATTSSRGAGLAAVEPQPRRRVGHPRGRPHLRDAGPGRRRHPLPAPTRGATGERQPVHGAQLVAPRPSTCSRPAGPTTRSPSTTRTSTTPAPRASPSRCSTPARCCGACMLDGVDTGDRFGALADAWATRIGDEPLVRVQRPPRGDGAVAAPAAYADAHAVVERLERYVATRLRRPGPTSP